MIYNIERNRYKPSANFLLQSYEDFAKGCNDFMLAVTRFFTSSFSESVINNLRRELEAYQRAFCLC